MHAAILAAAGVIARKVSYLAARSTASRSYDPAAAVEGVLDAIGIGDRYCDHRGASFSFVADGRKFLGACVFIENRFWVLSVRSDYTFRSMPRPIAVSIRDSKPDADGHDWDVIDEKGGGQHAHIFLCLAPASLTENNVGRRLYRMSQDIAEFDGLLKRNGYVS